MCGIVGVIGSNADELDVSAAVSKLVHRGPDDQAILVDFWYALGATRLSVTDPINGRQPHVNDLLQIAVIFNGQIYNYRELWKRYVNEVSETVSDGSDTHLIPFLYREFGSSFISQIDGMFAMCVLDLKSHEVLLARDRFGEKPLFYDFIQESHTLRFASEIEALAALEATRYQPDLNCIPEFLAQKHLTHESSGRFHIAELPPASYLSFRLGTSQVRLDSYWKSASHRPRLIVRNEKESQSAIESLLVKAIEERIPCDTPPAFALSGGIDSSLIVGLAHKYGLVRNAATYTLTYPNGLGGSGKTRDQIVARDVATLFKTDHREVCVYPEQVLEQFPNIVRAIGQPFIGTMSMWFLARAVVQDFKVLVSGDGADEQLGSYLTHRLAADVEQKWSLKSCLPDVDEELQIPVLASESIVAGEQRPWIWASTLFTADEAVNLLNADPKTVRDSYEFSAMHVVTRYRHHRSSNPVMTSLLLSELDTKFPDQVLKYIDRLSMAHGLEVRCPYLDHQLSDLLLSFDLNLRVRNGEFKWILKEVARTLLPVQVIDRPKEGFVSPFFLWRNEVLVPLARKFLTRRLVDSVGVFKWSAVEPMVLRLIQTDTVTHIEANKVLALIATQIWTSEAIS